MTDTKEVIGNAWKSGTERVSNLPGAGLVGSSYSGSKSVVVSTTGCVKSAYSGTVGMISSGYTSGKEKLASGYTSGKEKLASGYTSGKEKLASGYTSGKDYVVEGIKSGSVYVSETRAGMLIGGGVGRLLNATNSVVDYVLPEDSEEVEKDEEEEKHEDESGSFVLEEDEGQIEKARIISRKIRARMYHRTMNRLHAVQELYLSLLTSLKAHTELVSHSTPVCMPFTPPPSLHVTFCPVEGGSCREGHPGSRLPHCGGVPAESEGRRHKAGPWWPGRQVEVDQGEIWKGTYLVCVI